jgi:hypothetical protein
MDDIAFNIFRRVTNSIIKKYAPKAYHNKYEWEYEGNIGSTGFTGPTGNNDKITCLRVWLNDDRDDEPFMITLTQYEEDIIHRICKGLNFVPVSDNDMD